MATLLGALTVQFTFLFANVQMAREQAPLGWRWMIDADGLSHATRFLMLPQWDGDDTPIPVLTAAGYALVPRGEFAAARLGARPSERWADLGWLVLIVVGGQALAVAAYALINHQKR